MSKKHKGFINKSIDPNFSGGISKSDKGYKVCEICHKAKSSTKYRRWYDYINCEYDTVLCCDQCDGNYIEDSML